MTTKVAWSILRRYRVWAVVGASSREDRPSNEVMRFLIEHGYRVIPVNPLESVVLGEVCYPDLASIPALIEVVDLFRRSELVAPHVDEAIEIGAKAVWMQLGVVDEVSAARARKHGLEVVMDRCPAIELPKMLGG